MTEQIELLPLATTPGPMSTAAGHVITAALKDGRLDPAQDALGIAHLMALAGAIDRQAGRVDPRSLAILSRELRTTASDLGLGRTRAEDTTAGPFDFLNADPTGR